MKDITTYFYEGMRGLKRSQFLHYSAKQIKNNEVSINIVTNAIYDYISSDDERNKLFNKEFNKAKSVFKSLDILKTDEDNFYRVYARIGRKMELENPLSDEEIEQYIKDNDKEITEELPKVIDWYNR